MANVLSVQDVAKYTPDRSSTTLIKVPSSPKHDKINIREQNSLLMKIFSQNIQTFSQIPEFGICQLNVCIKDNKTVEICYK